MHYVRLYARKQMQLFGFKNDVACDFDAKLRQMHSSDWERHDIAVWRDWTSKSY